MTKNVNTTKKLPKRYQLFVERYLIHRNPSRAARESGFSEKSAHNQSYRLMRNEEIRKAIEAGEKEQSERNKVSADWVIQKLVRLAGSSLDQVVSWGYVTRRSVDMESGEEREETRLGINVFPSDSLAEDVKETIQEISESVSPAGTVTVKVKMKDSAKALELLGQHIGLFKQKLEVSDPDGKGFGVLIVPGVAGPEEWAKRAAEQQADLMREADGGGD